MKQFKKLFEPGKIGRMEVPNRIVYPPCSMYYTGFHDESTDRCVAFYQSIARGGTGLIIFGQTLVDNLVDTSTGVIGGDKIYDYRHGRYMAKVVEVMQLYGAKTSIQLSTGGGRQCDIRPVTDGRMPVSPSPIPAPGAGWTPREITVDEIKLMMMEMEQGAGIVRTAGFDSVEIHATHGYLTSLFLSPLTNKRTDEYGGTLRNRMRFLLEQIAAIKRAAGEDFPLIVRMPAEDFVKGGLTIDDGKEIARALVEAGVHALDITAMCFCDFPELLMPGMGSPRGPFLKYAEQIKKVVPVPLIVAGRMDPILGEKALEDGIIDFVGFARPLIADPDLPKKVRKGKWNEVRKCIFCNQGCLGSVFTDRYIVCTINPLAGRELDYKDIKPAAKPKKVMVIGAGPGGMEAARVAAMRGHIVTLYERAKELAGGQLKLAAIPPTRAEIRNIPNWYSVMFKKYDNLKVSLGVEVTAEMVKREKPDVVIIATGAELVKPDIPGVNRANVCTAADILSGKVKSGATAVVDGAGYAACGVAEFLADQGKKVTITTREEGLGRGSYYQYPIGAPVFMPTGRPCYRQPIGYDMNRVTLKDTLQRLIEKGVQILPKTTHKEVISAGVRVMDAEGKERVLKADTIVYAATSKPVNSLYSNLYDFVDEVYVIGDARSPRLIGDAVWEGFGIAVEI